MNKLIAALAATLVLAACATPPKVRANADPAANFQSYKTYTFANPLGTDRGGTVQTPLTSYFKESVRREMDARGYQFVEGGNADLFVNFSANARENVDLRTTAAPTYGYYGYRGGYYGGWYGYGGGSEVETVRYKVGTANIDLVDANRKQLVWEGIIEGKLTDKAMKDPRAAVSKAVAEIFKQFPGGTGSAPAAASSS